MKSALTACVKKTSYCQSFDPVLQQAPFQETGGYHVWIVVSCGPLYLRSAAVLMNINSPFVVTLSQNVCTHIAGNSVQLDFL